jgi:hypothetical protein
LGFERTRTATFAVAMKEEFPPRYQIQHCLVSLRVLEADSPPSGRVPGHDERNSWSVAKRLSTTASPTYRVHWIASGKRLA